ncbi:MAG TPA: hypothetical protein VF111_05090, partial [Thermoanaerobaculia bacterium]
RSFRVRLLLPGLDAIGDLEVDHECMPMRKREDGQIEMQAIVDETTLEELRRRAARDVVVEVLADRQVEAEAAAQLVSRTNRYADGSLPSGPGTRGAADGRRGKG